MIRLGECKRFIKGKYPKHSMYDFHISCVLILSQVTKQYIFKNNIYLITI